MEDRLIPTLIIIFIIGLIAAIGIRPLVGVFPFGPESTLNVNVTRLYVDVSGSGEDKESHYMVGTDQGVFEVDNSLWLWIWNSDEIYAQLQQGSNYTINIKGRKVVNWFYQEYPYITSVKSR